MRSGLRHGLWALAAALASAGGATAQVLQAQAGQAPAPAKALNIGDPAPALEIAEWIKGTPVKSFEKGRVYVVEFWATWCMPCVAGIPKLSELQAKYADKKVTVIGVSIDQNGMQAVTPFMERMGSKMQYTVALDRGGTNAAYMGASGVGGIPHAFVVDGNGKMVYHGHPAECLELVVMEAAAGKFDPSKHAERMSKFVEADAKFSAAREAKNWDDCEKVLDEIAGLRPDLARNLLITRYWIKGVGRGDGPGALAYSRTLTEGELKNDGEMLAYLAAQMASLASPSAEERAAAISVARRAVELTKEQNAAAHYALSLAYKKDGKFDEAIAAAEKAVAAAKEDQERRYYANNVMELKTAKEAAAKPDAPKTDAKPDVKPADAQP